MESYVGVVQLRGIYNRPVHPSPGGVQEPLCPMREENIRLVHYPDCQQLIIWLPSLGREYGLMRLIALSPEKVLEEGPVDDQLNGTIQLVRDTLPLPPGTYAIEIERNDGWLHRVELEKFEAGKEPAPELPENIPATDVSDEPIVYRDGAGNILENEDLLLREKLTRELIRKFSRRLEYTGTFRSGTIVYTDGENRLEFYHEMGGGDCMFYVDIPSVAQWEQQTRLPLSERAGIIEYLAETVQAQQAPSARYEIRENCIIYFHK